MEQILQFMTEITTPQLTLFLTGLFVPIMLYILAVTSVDQLLSMISFWKWKKQNLLLVLIVIFVCIAGAIFVISQTAFKDSVRQPIAHTSIVTMPGMDGDRTKQYHVAFSHPENIQPEEEVPLTFTVTDAVTDNPVQLFRIVYGKVAHVIIVDSTLRYFYHVHPTQEENRFSVTTQFPKDGMYHMYVDFQPWGGVEQQFGFTLNVGDVTSPVLSSALPDANKSKIFGQYAVSLKSPTLVASEMSAGKQQLIFTITDAKTGGSIRNLKPYLSAFGHLIMINQKTFEYVHVHPTDTSPVSDNAIGGPTVAFRPMSILKPVTPGVYRVFAQFNPDGNLFTADFTIQVK